MEQMYGVTDLTHLITTLTNNNTPQLHHQQSLLFSGAAPANHQHHHYDNDDNAMMMMLPACNGSFHHDQVCASMPAAAATNTTTNFSGGFEGSTYDQVGCNNNVGGGDVNISARWPRQETLTLLEIRSRLDYKFKEATLKGHLWDELSRIMYEEHGYQRSGKKCREKFENLYKYYKKTKEGKSGRRNGKHYRFFLQLEALYGPESNSKRSSGPSNDTNNNNLLSPSNSSHYDQQTSGSGNEMIETSKKRMKGTGSKWNKVDITDFIDAEMSKVMEQQDVLLDKMMRSIEEKEQEMLIREEKWRKQELERIEKENEFWAGERSWIEARDAALMEALHKFKKKGIISQDDQLVLNRISSSSRYDIKNICDDDRGRHSLCNDQGVQLGPMLSLLQPNDGSSSSRSNSNVANNNNNNSIQESCFRLFMGEGQYLNPWENYGVKHSNHGGN